MKWTRRKQEKGRRAEQIAADYLTELGYRIVKRNYRCKLGEVDLIARDGDEVVFVEVRSRYAKGYPDPAYSVDYRKQKKIAQVAEFFLVKHFKNMPTARFDVALVTLEDSSVDHIRDAFTVDGDSFYL